VVGYQLLLITFLDVVLIMVSSIFSSHKQNLQIEISLHGGLLFFPSFESVTLEEFKEHMQVPLCQLLLDNRI